MEDVANGRVSREITHLFQSWDQGDPDAINQVFVLVYNDLRIMARRFFREGAGLTLQPTALVHHVYERLLDGKPLTFENRVHFFNTARLLMRQILMEHARLRKAAKRGGGQSPETLDEGQFSLEPSGIDPETLLAMNDCLNRLKEMDPRKHRILELRFFLGLQIDEIAELLGISDSTILREWRTARSWLARELKHA